MVLFALFRKRGYSNDTLYTFVENNGRAEGNNIYLALQVCPFGAFGGSKGAALAPKRSLWEKTALGKKTPVFKIADVLNISPSKLLENDD